MKKVKHSESANKSVIKIKRDENLRFSFRFFDCSDEEVCPKSFPKGYTRALAQRIKDLSSWKVERFISNYCKSVRNHNINWNETSRPEGFSDLGTECMDAQAWQFAISSNEHGRVCGVIIDDTFYIIWLDQGHKVYPGK